MFPILKYVKEKRGARGDIVSEGRSKLHSRPLSTIDYIVISTNKIQNIRTFLLIYFNVLFDKSLYTLDC